MKRKYSKPEIQVKSCEPKKELCGGYYSTPRKLPDGCASCILLIIVFAVGLYCIL